MELFGWKSAALRAVAAASGWADAGRGPVAALAQLAGAFSGVVLALLPFATVGLAASAYDAGVPATVAYAAYLGTIGAWWLGNLVVIALPVAWLTSRFTR